MPLFLEVKTPATRRRAGPRGDPARSRRPEAACRATGRVSDEAT